MKKVIYILILVSCTNIVTILADTVSSQAIITIQNELSEPAVLYQVQNGANEIVVTQVAIQPNSSAQTCTIPNDATFSYTLAPQSASQPIYNPRNPNWFTGSALASSGTIIIKSTGTTNTVTAN